MVDVSRIGQKEGDIDSVDTATYQKGSLYYSDDHTAYATLNLIGKHQVIAHSREEYARGEGTTHINRIEGLWSYAKTWMYHYRGVPKEYFHLYLREIEFWFNYRKENLYSILTKCWSKLFQIFRYYLHLSTQL